VIVIFAGPTVTRDRIAAVVRAEVRPPAARGDVYRAATARPRAIGIVDGVFDGTPSVWHKEILWAMVQGIHVFGAASMGALRAAELDAFGMTGVGAVFEDFLHGRLEDDDEVAVAHASAEHGYRPTSEAMVNVRATLRAAATAGVLSAASVASLERLAKSWPYPERRFEALMAAGSGVGVPTLEMEAFGRWLPGGRVDQKAADAMQMLRLIADRDERGWEPKRVSYRMEHTSAWESLVSSASSHLGGEPSGAITDDLLDELLLRGEAGAAWDAALARAAALRLAEALRVELDPRAVAAAADEFRRERDLLSGEQFAAWLRDQGIADAEVDDFFRREATVRAVLGDGLDASLTTHVVDALRSRGAYHALMTRARAKRQRIESRGGYAPSVTAGVSDAELLRWQGEIEKCRGPSSVEDLARSQRSTVERLRAAVAREKLFVGSKGELEK